MGDKESLQALWQETLSAAQTRGLDPDCSLRPSIDRSLLAASATVVLASSEKSEAAEGIPSGVILGEVIGRGGLAKVHKAEQRRLDRPVAVKRLLDARSEDQRQDFLIEARVTGWLDHPNIVPVYDLEPQGASPSMIMKLVRGRAWSELLAERAGDDLRRHLDILLTVCNAVGFAHDKGIVHCDLKPENIMIGAFEEVLVMDWGLAVDVRAEERPPRARRRESLRGPCGTPRYMAPEQAEGRGRDLDERTDVFLLGAILYEILVGRPPHAGQGLFEVVAAASRAAPPDLPAETPESLADLCREALSREPGERPQSVAAFREAIADFLRHRESLIIAADASAKLDKARGGQDSAGRYADFAEAVAGFRQARLLWSENALARDGERRARLTYARAALEQGDLGLARAQSERVAEPGEDLERLRAAIEDRQRERERARSSGRRARRGLATALAALVLGLVGGLTFAVHSGRVERGLREQESAARKKAVLAEERASAALKNETRARENEAEARGRAERLLARAYRERATGALELGDPIAAEMFFARALQGADRDEDRRSELRSGLFLSASRAPRLLWTRSPNPGFSIFEPLADGERVVVYDRGTRGLSCWSLKTGAFLFPIARGFKLKGIGDPSRCPLRSDPAGRWFVAAGSDDRLRLFSQADWLLAASLRGPEGNITMMRFFGDRLLVGTSSLVQAFELPEGRVLWKAKRPASAERSEAERAFKNPIEFRDAALLGPERVVLALTREPHGLMAGLAAAADIMREQGLDLEGKPLKKGAKRPVLGESILSLRSLETGEELASLTMKGVMVTGLRSEDAQVVARDEEGRDFLWDGRSAKASGPRKAEIEAPASQPSPRRNVIVDAAWDPEGEGLIALEKTEELVWLDAEGQETGRRLAIPPPLPELQPPSAPHFIRTHKSGRIAVAPRDLASQWGRRILVWDRKGRLIKRLAPPPTRSMRITSLRFTPDGRGLVSSQDKSGVILWPIDEDAPARVVATEPDYLRSAVLDGAGTRVVTFGYESGVRVRDLATGALIRERTDFGPLVGEPAHHPRRPVVAFGTVTGKVAFWDYQADRVTTEDRAGELVLASAYAPDGRLAASDLKGIRLLAKNSGETIARLPGEGERIKSLRFDARGTRLAVVRGSALDLWSVPPSPERTAGSDRVVSQAFTSGALAAIGHEHLYLWSAPDGRLLKRFEVKGLKIEKIVFAGEQLLGFSRSQGLGTWDLDSGEYRLLVPLAKGEIGAGLALSKRGPPKVALSLLLESAVKLFDLESEELTMVTVLEDRKGAGLDSITALDFGRDGSLAAAGKRGVSIVDLESGARRFFASESRPWKVLLHPDGRRVIVCGRKRTVAVHDRSDGRLLASYSDHPSPLTDAAIVCEGAVLLTLTTTNHITAWDLKSHKKLLGFRSSTIPNDNERYLKLATDPSGRWLAVNGAFQRIRLFDLEALERARGDPAALLEERGRQGFYLRGFQIHAVPYTERSRARFRGR